MLRINSKELISRFLLEGDEYLQIPSFFVLHFQLGNFSQTNFFEQMSGKVHACKRILLDVIGDMFLVMLEHFQNYFMMKK